MGNIPSGNGPRLLDNGKYFSYHINLDKEATITVTKDQKNSVLKYDTNRRSCTVSISINRNSDEYCMNITDYFEKDYVKIFAEVRKEKEFVCITITCLNEEKPIRSGITLRAGVETEFLAYGSGTSMSLLVIEKKKKSNEERPYMVTVAHYYVNGGSGANFGGNFGESGVDIGFSVVVKIGVHNGQLDCSVDGPVEHPSSALRYMIDELFRTGTWKLSACPHCKNIQSQRRWVSESEDSDTPLPPPPPRRYGGSQNAANMGRFNGDGNGSFIQARKVNFNKWLK